MSHPIQRIVLACAAAILAVTGVLAQAYPSSQFANEPFRPYTPGRSGPPPPRFVIQAAGEFDVPGPLGSGVPRFAEGAWAIETSGGIVTVRVDSGEFAVEPGARLPDAGEAWAIGGRRGKRRFGTLPEGMVVAQKRCGRCKAGWKKSWKLKMPGSTPAPPVALGNRVFVGAVDNRVYGLKARNGHRVWAADAGGRVLQSPTLWTGSLDRSDPSAPTFSVLLVIPDGAPRMLVLDPYDGRKLAEASFPNSAGLSRPVVTDDGRILLGRQGYDPADAAVLVLAVVPKDPEEPSEESGPPAPPGEDPMTYNGEVPDEARPTDRPAVVESAP